MESINLNGISFQWSDDQLVVMTARGQDILSAANAAQLLDFLQLHQQEMYAGEQGRELPPWARDERRYVSGTREHQSLRLEERVPQGFLQKLARSRWSKPSILAASRVIINVFSLDCASSSVGF